MANHLKCACGECGRCRHRVYMREWYRRNQERVLETARRTRARHLAKIQQYDRERGYRPGDPQKKRARRAVATAIRNGTLERHPCEVCGSDRVQAHHEDYARALDVRWLCTRHHGQLHRRFDQETADQP